MSWWAYDLRRKRGCMGGANAVTPSDHCTISPSLSRCMRSNLPWTGQKDRDGRSMYGRVYSPHDAQLNSARIAFFAEATRGTTTSLVAPR